MIVNQLQQADEVALVTFYANKMKELTGQIEQVADVTHEISDAEARCQQKQEQARAASRTGRQGQGQSALGEDTARTPASPRSGKSAEIASF